MKERTCVPCQSNSGLSGSGSLGELNRAPAGPFASATVAEHLIRGGVAVGAIYVTVAYGAQLGLLSLGLFAVALFALRGCPMCWTVGLFETLSRRTK